MNGQPPDDPENLTFDDYPKITHKQVSDWWGRGRKVSAKEYLYCAISRRSFIRTDFSDTYEDLINFKIAISMEQLRPDLKAVLVKESLLPEIVIDWSYGDEVQTDWYEGLHHITFKCRPIQYEYHPLKTIKTQECTEPVDDQIPF